MAHVKGRLRERSSKSRATQKVPRATAPGAGRWLYTYYNLSTGSVTTRRHFLDLAIAFNEADELVGNSEPHRVLAVEASQSMPTTTSQLRQDLRLVTNLSQLLERLPYYNPTIIRPPLTMRPPPVVSSTSRSRSTVGPPPLSQGTLEAS